MSEHDRDENLVDLKAWKKEKVRQSREKQRVRASGGTINLSSPRAQKVVLALFILVIVWLAMPKNYFATIGRAIGL